MINFENFEFQYEPYPSACAQNIFPPETYKDLINSFPDIEKFEYKPKLGHKYSLSRFSNPNLYWRFIDQNPTWTALSNFFKSRDFFDGILDVFSQNNVDIPLNKVKWHPNKWSGQSSLWSRIRRHQEVRCRFEFSAMGGDGGSIKPHTDGLGKIITLVFSMCDDDEWKTSWGGGTSISKPKDKSLIYNEKNTQLEFDDVETINTYEFVPNQCVMFLKTYNSWHHVAPIQAPSANNLRKTLTVNIELIY